MGNDLAYLADGAGLGTVKAVTTSKYGPLQKYTPTTIIQHSGGISTHSSIQYPTHFRKPLPISFSFLKYVMTKILPLDFTVFHVGRVCIGRKAFRPRN